MVDHLYVDSELSGCQPPNSPCNDSWNAPSGATLHSYYPPSVVSWGPQRLDVFVTGTLNSNGQNHVFRISWDAGQGSGWVDIGAPFPGAQIVSRPAAVSATQYANSNNIHEIDIYVNDGDFIYTATVDDGGLFYWNSAAITPPFGRIYGDQAAVSWGPGRIDLFSWDGTSYWDYVAGSWYQWSLPPGLTFSGDPAAVALGDDRLLVAGRTSDGGGQMTLWDFGGNSWVRMNGGFGTSLSMSSW